MTTGTKVTTIDPLAQLMGNQRHQTASKEKDSNMSTQQKEKDVQNFMLHIPVDLHRAIKSAAGSRGERMQTVIIDCLTEGFAEELERIQNFKK